jgi:hypothetical protein
VHFAKLEKCVDPSKATDSKAAEACKDKAMADEVSETKRFQSVLKNSPSTQNLYASSVLAALHNVVSKSVKAEWRRDGWHVYCFKQALADMEANKNLKSSVEKDAPTPPGFVQVDEAFAEMPGFSPTCSSSGE